MLRQLVLVAALGASVAGSAQTICPHSDECASGAGFIFAADRRVFAVFAFLNAVGYDEQPASIPMHPVRATVREMVAATLRDQPERVERWRRWYVKNRLPVWVFADFAVALAPERPFQIKRPLKHVHYAAGQRIRDLPTILEEFWTSADLDLIWHAVKPEYSAELAKYAPDKTVSELAFVWKYLRMPRADTLTLVHIPNLLQAHYQAVGAQYDHYFYSVESPGSHRYGLNVHEYLHSVVNEAVRSTYRSQRKKLEAYFISGRSGSMSQPYGTLESFVAECLIRALDKRIRLALDPSTRERMQSIVDKETAGGLLLTTPFYELLMDFERADKSLDQYLHVLLEALPVHR